MNYYQIVLTLVKSKNLFEKEKSYSKVNVYVKSLEE